MNSVSLGDLAQTFLLRRQNAGIKNDLQRLTAEMTSGRITDLGAKVGGDFSPLAGLQSSLARLATYATVTAETGLAASTMQDALTNISDQASKTGASLVQAGGTADPTFVTTAAIAARQSFDSAISALNTRIGDRSLFAGQATDGQALASANSILADLQTAIAGETTGQGVADAVSAWFDSATGFHATGYLGSAEPPASVRVSDGVDVSLGVTAADPVVTDTLKGLAMAALLDAGTLSSAGSERTALAQIAGTKLLETATDRAQLSARLGTVQAEISSSETRNTAESSRLELARADIVSADPYTTATALQSTQTQLDTLYALTARLSRLTLVDYLK